MVELFSRLKGNIYLRLLIAFIFVISALLLFLYFNGKKLEERDILKLELNLENKSLYNNQPLNFLADLYYAKRCVGILQYEVFKLDNTSIVINRIEDIDLSNKISKRDTLALNKLLPGDYILRAKIKCNGNSEISIARFSILPIKQNISNSNFSEQTIKKAAESPTSEIVALSNQNFNETEQMCNLLDTEKKDECLSGLAEKTKNKGYCSMVRAVSTKDGCYMSLALEGVPIACADIYDSYQRNACYSIKSKQQS